MRFRLFFGVLILVLNFSCRKENKNQKSISNIKESNEKRTFIVNETVKSSYLLLITDWKELSLFDTFLKDNYQKTSFKEALNSSAELSNLSKILQDSVLPKQIDDISFKARLNLLNTECLRLHDMSLISSIKSDEVFYQVSKVFDAYSFMNAKINAMLEQQELERLYGDDRNLLKDKFVVKDSLKNEIKRQNPSSSLQDIPSKEDPKLLKKSKPEFKRVKN